MPYVNFSQIVIGKHYSRHELAQHWGYASFHAIARGVVTPKDDNKIIIFVTQEKRNDAMQYADKFDGEILEWEGPTDHFGESRMVNASQTGDTIHLFYRAKHHTDFIYAGPLTLLEANLHSQQPSRFKFIVNVPSLAP